jgi:hypothetical protein
MAVLSSRVAACDLQSNMYAAGMKSSSKKASMSVCCRQLFICRDNTANNLQGLMAAA